MLNYIKEKLKPQTETLNTIFISREKVLKNIDFIQDLQKESALFPVLKSNAYGHGIVQMLEIFKKKDFPYVVVDSFPEYQIVHKKSKLPILLLGETLKENYKFFDTKRTAFAVYNSETLEYLWKMWKKIFIHVFLNTGMNREWIKEEWLNSFLLSLKQFPNILLEWVMSHFYSADKKDNSSINEQITLFKKMYKKIEEFGFAPKWRHIGASAWILQMNDGFFNAFRPWIICYWYNPLEFELPWKTDRLEPALSLISRVVSIQDIKKWEWISYSHNWKAEKEEKVATIAFGYAEWFFRSLSGKLFFSHKNQIFQQIGNICMNLSIFLADENIKIWDKITVISCDKNTNNSINYIAKSAQTIPYEILVKLDKGIRRVVK